MDPVGRSQEHLENRKALLRYEHVQICYNGKPAVEDVSLSVAKGEILAIVGESGSGKSTLLRAASGLLGNGGMVSRGDIYFRDIDIPDATPQILQRLRGSEIGMIFQDAAASFSPVRRIQTQIEEAVLAHEKMSKGQIHDMAAGMLLSMGVGDAERILKSYPFELSGGLNQRVGIMLAMLLHPALLLADEPTSALDVRVQARVIRELLRIREKYGTAIVMVTHNIALAQRVADRIAVMYRGRIIESGETEQIMRQPREPYTRELLEAMPHLRPR